MIDQSCCPETENKDDFRAGLDKSTLKVVFFQRYNISSIYWLSAAYKINIVLQYFHIKFTLVRTPIGAAQLPNRSYFVPTNHKTLCHQSQERKTCTAEPSFLFTLCQPAILTKNLVINTVLFQNLHFLFYKKKFICKLLSEISGFRWHEVLCAPAAVALHYIGQHSSGGDQLIYLPLLLLLPLLSFCGESGSGRGGGAPPHPQTRDD